MSCSTANRTGRLLGRVAASLLVALLGFPAGFLVLPAALLVGVAALLTPAGRQPS